MLVAGSAHAATIRGHVFDDANRDGARDRAERGVPHAVVAFGTEVFAEADADGMYTLTVPDDAAGIVWVRVPEGFRPEPVWARWSGSGEVDLGVHRLVHPLVQPLTFVAASDAHLGDKPDAPRILGAAIERATAGAPAWFTILGDITQGARKDEFDLVAGALAQLWGVAWIPVPGNHDWYDGGLAWADRIGADNYSFDAGGVHFVVWNMALSDLAIEEFLRRDLARVNTPVVALTHAPPSPAIDELLATLRIRYVLTGHAHSNRVVEHPGVTEYNTEPFLMGGLDFTPAGYRVMTLDRDRLSSAHHVTVDAPFVAVMAPARGQCAPRSHGELIVAAELDATAPVVTAKIDCGTPITLRWAGGWDWRAELPALAPGAHEVHVTAATSEAHGETSATFTVCDPPPAPPPGDAWPQLGGNPAHTGATSRTLAPALAPRWVTAVGGHLLSASPAIARGLVYVTVTDLGDGTTGGLVALDLQTGAIRWRTPTALQVRGGVAVVDDVVVVPRIDGVILGLDADTGTQRWTYTLRPGTAPEAAATFASIAADGADVMIGHQRAFAVVAADDGHPRWRTDPVPEGENSQSLSAVAIGEGRVVGTFNRLWGGVQAWDRATGSPLWQREEADTVGINATPVIADHSVFVVDAADEVTALDLATGTVKWTAALDPDGFEWGNATIGTPVYARGILVVPTLYRDLVALDATTGAELWRHPGLPSPLRATHYRGTGEAGYEASPIIAGEQIWIADTSGELAALDLRTGAPRYRAAIGAPVLSGLAASGDWLVVASFDGTVRALASATPAFTELASCAVPARGCATTTPTGWLAALLVAMAAACRSRRC